MPTSAYIDGTGVLRQRSLSEGDGSLATPDVAEFTPKYLNDAPITGATMPAGGIGVIGWLSAIWKQLTGVELTPGFISTTASGTVTAGARTVTIKNVGGAVGTVLTINLPTGESVNFAATGKDTVGAITYNATGTTFLISEVR